MRLIWLISGLLALSLGVIGAFLPLLPTVPLLLLAAFFFAKSSESLHNWLLTHPVFGPPIDDWRRSGSINRRAKLLATASIAAAFTIPAVLGLRFEILAIQAVVLVGVLVFIWTRPTA